MVSTINFSTEQVASKLYPNGHCKINTSINNSLTTNTYSTVLGFELRRTFSMLGTLIYLQSEAATEPVSDDLLNFTVWNGPAVTYSVTAGNYVMSWTSDTGFFSVDTNFSEHDVKWIIYYLAWYTGTPQSGYTPVISFEFYKRDTANNDTLLFKTSNIGVTTLLNASTFSVAPTGSVTTSDRLRIRVKSAEVIPT